MNPPPAWQLRSAPPALVVQPGAPTDFWQGTHYGFREDNGHFLGLAVEGDFSMATRVRFHPRHQYDQAGLMVRVGPHCWVKTSVEYEPVRSPRLGVVVTNQGFSDWSVQDFPASIGEIAFRICREGADFIVEFNSGDSGSWSLLRVTHLDIAPAAAVACGVYACSPKGIGFQAEFEVLTITRHTKETA